MPKTHSVRISKPSNSKTRIRRMRSRKKRNPDIISQYTVLQTTIGNQATGRMIQAQLQSKEKSDSASLPKSDMQQNIHQLHGKGFPLPRRVRHYFESRFGADFSEVRIHTDANAEKNAQSIHARAFTVGQNIVFGAGEYAPDSKSGQQLLAHELTHVVQQSGRKSGITGEDASAQVASAQPSIQRKLQVDHTVPTDENEPARGMPQPEFEDRVNSQANELIQGLCNAFKVESNGEINLKNKNEENICANPESIVNNARKPLGCCCLCTMTAAKTTPWKLIVSEFRGPSTNDRDREVVVHPTTSDFTFGSWSKPALDKSEKLRNIDPVVVLGHELCGHAALHELDAHPEGSVENKDRLKNNAHDPTVKVENQIAHEFGRDESEDRALASQGSHRGESTAKVTIKNFPFNASSRFSLPKEQRDLLTKVKNFAVENNLWIDIFGHSDTIGSPSAKLDVSQRRANATKKFLIDEGLSAKFSKFDLTGVDRYTQVEGRSDFDLLPGSIPGIKDPKLRRVDIIMASRPAGAHNPVPEHQRHSSQEKTIKAPGKVKTILDSGNACEKHLIKTAWT